MTLMTAHIVAILISYVLGHNFSFYMGFRGGKGTATTLGMLFAIDWRLGLGALLTMVVVILITDYIAVGTVAMLVVMIIYTAVIHPGVITLVAVIGLTAMSLYKHRMNFVRIVNGTEKRVRSVLFAKKS